MQDTVKLALAYAIRSLTVAVLFGLRPRGRGTDGTIAVRKGGRVIGEGTLHRNQAPSSLYSILGPARIIHVHSGSLAVAPLFLLQGGLVFAVAAVATPISGLSGQVLLLNAHYMALCIVSVRRAFTLLFKRDDDFQPIAEVVHVEQGRYISYDFEDWAALSRYKHEFERDAHDWIRTVRFELAVPRIIRVLTFAKLPRREVKFNRRNLFARDRNMCQYCGRRFPTSELTLDHIVPRSHGGHTNWGNIVCACVKCNVQKGGRTPEQAHMHLIRPPVKPKRNPALSVSLSDRRYSSWKQFLDAAYWDVELK